MEIWMVAVVAAALVAGLLGIMIMLRRKSQREQGTERLKSKFGSEYGSTVAGAGRKKGEADLAQRQERVEGFDLRPLAEAESERFTRLWTAAQARFVDDPGGAVSDADHLLNEVMQARGYPVADFEQRAADLSVGHPEFVANYRAAHAQALRHSRGDASTEDLRQAMVHYTWLFTDLVATDRRPELQASAV